MLKENNIKIKDTVKFKMKQEEHTGIVTAIHQNKKLIRVRIIKNGRRCWHEWLRIEQL